MRITILGAGAMVTLFGGYLSQENDVWLMDVDAGRIAQINADGARIREKDGEERRFHPVGVTSSTGLPEMDLILVFVKSMYTLDALSQNQSIIGRNTYLMTLQNGAGHDAKLLQFADKEHVIIGSTQHNAVALGNGYSNHGGSGISSIGLLSGKSAALAPIAQTFNACGIQCVISDDVKRQIWNKLFTNTSASSLTAVLQVPLEFIYDDPDARSLMIGLCKEAVAVANAECSGQFDVQKVVEDVESICKNAKNGYTSIYADIKNGRRTEVDTISGSVLEAGDTMGIPVPYHNMVVHLIHALENKAKLMRREECENV